MLPLSLSSDDCSVYPRRQLRNKARATSRARIYQGTTLNRKSTDPDIVPGSPLSLGHRVSGAGARPARVPGADAGAGCRRGCRWAGGCVRHGSPRRHVGRVARLPARRSTPHHPLLRYTNCIT